MRRIGFDLLPQLSHEHPEVFRLVHRVRAPDRFQDDAVRQHAPRIAHQQREQLEFLRRESNFLVAAQHAAAVVIDREIAEQGRIWAENCAGGGAQFSIVVPAESRPTAPAEQTA